MAKRGTCALILALGVSICALPGDAYAQPLGRDTLEVRLQSAAKSVNATGVAFAPPGFAYFIDSDIFTLNLIGGVGYFLTDLVSVGADTGFTVIGGDGMDTTYTFGLIPYVKVVSNMGSGGAGGFGEIGIGFDIVKFDSSGSDVLFTLGGWGGLHAFLGKTTALQLGPFARLVRNPDAETNEGIFGLRLGLSAYVP